jgi:plastocyanin
MPRSSRHRSSSRRAPIALALALGLLLAGSGPRARAAGQAARSAARTVVMEAVSFQPAVLTLRLGESVTWRNADPFPHTATGAAFDSKSIAAGASWAYRPRARGELPYVCTLHPTMRAILRVE